jgi:CrcB protein
MRAQWLLSALVVGVGGFVGSAFRYGLSTWIGSLSGSRPIPLGTLIVNVLGCLVLGFLAGLGETRLAIGPQWRLLLFVGLLGGFTTFSTFGYETMLLVRHEELGRAALNVLAQVALGLVAVWTGLVIARAW